MNRKVSFLAMDQGTREEYDPIEAPSAARLADRVLAWLRPMDGESPYRIHPPQHVEPLVRELFAPAVAAIYLGRVPD